MSAEVEREREAKKLIESLQAEIAIADNLTLHYELSEKSREVTIDERRRVTKLQNELKQMSEEMF